MEPKILLCRIDNGVKLTASFDHFGFDQDGYKKWLKNS